MNDTLTIEYINKLGFTEQDPGFLNPDYLYFTKDNIRLIIRKI